MVERAGGDVDSRTRAKLDQLRAKVDVMRELGVVVWDGITLGPEPLPKAVREKIKEDPLAHRRAYYANLLNRPVTDEELKRLP